MAIVTTSRGFPLSMGDRDASYFYGILKNIYDQGVFGKLNNFNRFNTIDIIKSLVSNEAPHFSTLDEWFLNLLEDDRLDEVRLQLVFDTLVFIETGYRRLPLAAYSTMFQGSDTGVRSGSYTSVSENKYDLHMKLREKSRAYAFTIRRGNHTKEGLLCKWLAQEDGFMDMVRFFIFITEPDVE